MTSCSLLIPCHNAAVYLPRLWKTIESQTVSFDEVICYDDGSNDDTAIVAEKLGARVIRSEKCRGAAYARNQLARESRYSWFHFHDADDLLLPNYLETVKEKIDKTTDVVICNVDWIDALSKELLIAFRYKQHELNQDPVTYTLSHPIGGINGFYRKDTFLSIGGFDESMRVWEDADLHVRLAHRGAKFSVVEVVLAISLRDSSTPSHNYVENWRHRFSCLQKYVSQLDLSYHPEIANQAEIVAKNLLELKDSQTALTAINLCLSLGHKPPKTNNKFIQLLKLILPSLWVIYVQQSIRRLMR